MDWEQVLFLTMRVAHLEATVAKLLPPEEARQFADEIDAMHDRLTVEPLNAAEPPHTAQGQGR